MVFYLSMFLLHAFNMGIFVLSAVITYDVLNTRKFKKAR
jgi:hypothetical protein